MAATAGSFLKAVCELAGAGVMGLTKTDASNYAAQGIRLNAMCPGYIPTPLSKNSRVWRPSGKGAESYS